MNLIVDFLTCLWEYAKERITQDIGAVADLGQCLRKNMHYLLILCVLQTPPMCS